jgi:hypothetical protein
MPGDVRYEYKVIKTPAWRAEDELNAAAEEGWTLVSTTAVPRSYPLLMWFFFSSDAYVVATFRRPWQEEKSEGEEEVGG